MINARQLRELEAKTEREGKRARMLSVVAAIVFGLVFGVAFAALLDVVQNVSVCP